MTDTTHSVEDATTRGGLPVSPSLGPALSGEHVPAYAPLVDRRVVLVTTISVLLAIAAAFIAEGLMLLIGLITNISFYGRVSTSFAPPTTEYLGAFVIVIPVIGGLIVGLMARYGSEGIRGHSPSCRSTGCGGRRSARWRWG
ncbi:MAG TPA: hypothetical protein VGI81_12330 [Tepidisphaeraceae bacterium]